MRIGIIGAGKLGCALAIGLKENGFDISGVFSRSEESAGFLCERLGVYLPNSLAETIKNSDVVFITVPDGQIESTAYSIADTVNVANISGKTFFHCSGALGSDTLSVLSEIGAFTASFHPIQTFADRELSWKGLEGIYFGFEGSDEAKKKAGSLVEAFRGSMLVIRKEDKPLYHAAACILSNYTVTLSYIAGKLFGNIGIDAASGIRAFTPLVEKTVKNIEELGCLKALTGPISRGDYAVVEKHLENMGEKTPEVVPVYKILAKMTVEAAAEKGSINQDTANNLLKVLKK